jgi:FKBP-type peptidyl-prolyl cis-trans isomerase SlyD
MKRFFWGGLALLVLLALCSCAPATVAEKKMVSMDYTGTLTDGTVFSKSEDGKPLEFLVGGGTLLPVLEKGMVGMKVGETRKIPVAAKDAYGEYHEAGVQKVSRDKFPKEQQIEVGQQYQMQTGSGTLVMTVTAVTDKEVTIDLNHPLAGKDLTFSVKVVKIRDATKEELAAVKTASTAAAQ